MSREKQIEEMARDLCHLTCTCEECGNVAEVNKHRCKAKVYARRAYEAGYRKQSEVEVVRCGNCKYFYKGRVGNRCTLSLGLKVPHRDAWCCYGERKES